MLNIEAVELLLEDKADVNIWLDEAPIKLACSQQCDIKILQKLLAAGAKINNLPLKIFKN